MEELKKLALPLIEFLKKNYNPHTSIVITADYIRIVSDEVGIPIKEEAPVATTTDASKTKELITEINKVTKQNTNVHLRIYNHLTFELIIAIKNKVGN